MVTIIYTTIVSWRFIPEVFWTGSRTLILDVFVFCLLQSFLYICVVCKCFFVVNRVLVCCSDVRWHLIASFFFGRLVIGRLWKFSCFVTFLSVVFLMLLLVLHVLGAALFPVALWLGFYIWFAKIFVDDFNLSSRFGGRSLTSLLTREYDCWSIEVDVITSSYLISLLLLLLNQIFLRVALLFC